jgi:hypothetical protein
MLSSRYTELEFHQWDAACSGNPSSRNDALRQTGSRATLAKGQGEPTQLAGASSLKLPNPNSNQADWASECLFDCYND